MAERSTISQIVQIGFESTPGTAVAATKKLRALSFNPVGNLNFTAFKPMGYKYPTIEALIQEWSESPIDGFPTYTEIVVPLSCILQAATPVVASGVSTWTFTPATSSEDTIKTLTIERGSAVQAERVAYGLIDEFGISFSRTESGLSGHLIAKAMELGFTLTTAGPPGTYPTVPITPPQIDVYLDATSGALGTTKLLRVKSISYTIGGRFGPLWVLNSGVSGFAAHVETDPDARFEIELEADANGMALLTAARSDTLKFLRLKATGPLIGVTGTNYSLQIDAAVKVSAAGGPDDSDAVQASTYTLTCVHDETWGKSHVVTVVNDVATL